MPMQKLPLYTEWTYKFITIKIYNCRNTITGIVIKLVYKMSLDVYYFVLKGEVSKFILWLLVILSYKVS